MNDKTKEEILRVKENALRLKDSILKLGRKSKLKKSKEAKKFLRIAEDVISCNMTNPVIVDKINIFQEYLKSYEKV